MTPPTAISFTMANSVTPQTAIRFTMANCGRRPHRYYFYEPQVVPPPSRLHLVNLAPSVADTTPKQ